MPAGKGFAQLKQQTRDIRVTDCPRSQKQADIWYFGVGAGIDFRSGTAIPLTDTTHLTANNSFKSTGVISDSLGNLLFLTNGKYLWDRNFNPFIYAPAMEGDAGVTQPCIIIPQPGNDRFYYIFTIDIFYLLPDNTYNSDTKGLTYSVVDMTKSGGLGDFTDDWNIPLLNPVTQKLTACKHANGIDYWILAHKWDSDEFYAYLLTADGLQPPVISKAGTSHTGGYHHDDVAYGYMKLSPDGTRIGLAISGLNRVELLNFSTSSGVVSNATHYDFSLPGISPYGIEFSPDNRMLYTNLSQLIGNGPPANASKVFQFDLRNGLTNPVLIDTVAGERLGGMQLATDGRIYCARTVNIPVTKDSLDVIYNPNRPGLECNFNLLNNIPVSRFSLAGRKCVYGLPNFMQSWFNLPPFRHDSVCRKDVTRFTILNDANIDSVHWDFGDGATSTVMDPVHVYGSFGNYTVKLREIFNGISYTDSVRITIYDLPVVELGDTILLYEGSSFNIHAGSGFQEYTWSNGSTDSILTVEGGGNFWVQVKDFNCCVNTDSVYVKLFRYFIPTAFTPNGDGINDKFRIIGLYKNIQFQLTVYDRWGKMVHQSEDLDTGWDGTSDGSVCPAATYAWIASIRFLGQDIVNNGNVVLKGTVTLVR